jgi:hypothetical protein
MQLYQETYRYAQGNTEKEINIKLSIHKTEKLEQMT